MGGPLRLWWQQWCINTTSECGHICANRICPICYLWWHRRSSVGPASIGIACRRPDVQPFVTLEVILICRNFRNMFCLNLCFEKHTWEKYKTQIIILPVVPFRLAAGFKRYEVGYASSTMGVALHAPLRGPLGVAKDSESSIRSASDSSPGSHLPPAGGLLRPSGTAIAAPRLAAIVKPMKASHMYPMIAFILFAAAASVLLPVLHGVGSIRPSIAQQAQGFTKPLAQTPPDGPITFKDLQWKQETHPRPTGRGGGTVTVRVALIPTSRVDCLQQGLSDEFPAAAWYRARSKKDEFIKQPKTNSTS